MSSVFGEKLRCSLFGQSHGEAIGAVLDGLPAGELVDLEQLNAFLQRRAPGQNAWSTKRQEADSPKILSGLVNGRTCGAPLTLVIENTDTRSNDYAPFADQPRPGHADYPAHIKHHGFEDGRGGGHFSGRVTAALCMAGGVCLQLLERRGIFIGAHILHLGGVDDTGYDPVSVDSRVLGLSAHRPFPTLDEKAGAQMIAKIAEIAKQADSIGGVIQAGAVGLPVGLGEPVFGGMENKISQAMFAIGAVKGIAFGSGFEAAKSVGSLQNDPFDLDKAGHVVTKTNHHGGILGGLSTGMPLLVQVAMKPTPSIGQVQNTLSLSAGAVRPLQIKGRHDPCIVPRAVPCVEAALALAITDLILSDPAQQQGR